MVVRPFNDAPGYNFSDSCEIVAIQSCNLTELDFSVRVDFLTDTTDLGAVGVHKDEFVWVSRENGDFVSNSPGQLIEADGSLFYPASDIRITENATAMTTTIKVGDGIGVTIVHNYNTGKEYRTIIVRWFGEIYWTNNYAYYKYWPCFSRGVHCNAS